MTVRLLLVDDHEVVREGLAAALTAGDAYEIVGTAGTGARGIVEAGRARPDLALIDHRLPDMAGDDLCRGIRATSTRTVVVVLSSYVGEDTVRDAFEAGASAYVSKAAGLAELRQTLEEVLAGSPEDEPVIARQLRDLVVRRRETLSLTPQQERVLELAAEGLTYREVGERLYISESTVRFHMQKLKIRFEARTKTELIAKAIRTGWLPQATEDVHA